tara:strand:- start:73 stop:1050 length:978 start_codon:yes stop_codon:yes gene_type:complete
MATSLKYFLEISDIDKNYLPSKKILSIGSNIIGTNYIPKNIAKKLNIDEKFSNNEIKKIRKAKKNNDLTSYYKTNKELLNYIVKNMGYESYEDADINEFADNYLNLNDENLPNNLKNKKFGVIFESGTSNYATNILNAYKNISNLCTVGTKVISVSEPNTFNRYPLKPSPNFTIDYFAKNGFKVNKSQIIDNNIQGSKVADLNIHIQYKERYLTQYFNFGYFIKHILYQILNNFFWHKENSYIEAKSYHLINNNNFKNYLKKYPNKKIFEILRKFFKKIFNVFYGKFNKVGRCELFFVFEKIKDIEPSIKNCSHSSLFYNFENKQ